MEPNFNNLLIAATGGAFLGGAIVQAFGGGKSQLLGAAIGTAAGWLLAKARI